VPQQFKDDRDVVKAFAGFQTACMVSMKKAAMVRQERQEKAAAEKAAELETPRGEGDSAAAAPAAD